MSNQLKITLVKSLIGRIPKHIHIANQLGLRKTNSSAVHDNNPAIRGMINQISYLLDVKECSQ